MIQGLADDFREWRLSRNQSVAKRRVARRDFWRRQIGKPWIELIPASTPWLLLILFWALVYWAIS